MKDIFYLHLARIGWAGKSPIMPGTAGSLVAILIAPWIFMPLPFWGRVLMLIIVFYVGVLVCSKVEHILGRKDPQEVVIDEFFGQWLVCLPFSNLTLLGYLAAFLLFRLFDIAKPWPVRNLERIPSGLGVMLDDGMAGVYAMLVLIGGHWVFG